MILLMFVIHVSVIVMASFVAEPVKTSQILYVICLSTVFALYSVLHTLLILHILLCCFKYFRHSGLFLMYLDPLLCFCLIRTGNFWFIMDRTILSKNSEIKLIHIMKFILNFKLSLIPITDNAR